MRIITLTERRPALCRLTAAQLAFLVSTHRRHLRIEPSGRSGIYRLTPTRLVGVLFGPGLRLVVRPKLLLPSLLSLLDPDAPVEVREGGAANRRRPSPGAGAELLDILAGLFARRLEALLAAGLAHVYRERPGQGPLLQGRLDLPATLQAHRPAELHFVADERTADVPCNRALASTLDLVLAHPLLADEVKRRLRSCREAFVGVSPDASAIDAEAPDVSYRELLRLARLLRQGAEAGPGLGGADLGFLLDLERVFEDHVARLVRAALAGQPGHVVSEQELFHVAEQSGRADWPMRPDVVVRVEGRPCLVVDAKWKRRPPGGVRPADLYQVLSYCLATGAGRGLLVYPGRRRLQIYRPSPGCCLALASLPLFGTAEQAERGRSRLAQDVLWLIGQSW